MSLIYLIAFSFFCGHAHSEGSPESRKAESDAPFEAVAPKSDDGLVLPLALAQTPAGTPAPASAGSSAPQPPAPKFWENRLEKKGKDLGALIGILGLELPLAAGFISSNSLETILSLPGITVLASFLFLGLVGGAIIGTVAGGAQGKSMGRKKDLEERIVYKKALRAYKKQQAAKKKEELLRKLAAPAVPIEEESVDDSAEDRFKL